LTATASRLSASRNRANIRCSVSHRSQPRSSQAADRQPVGANTGPPLAARSPEPLGCPPWFARSRQRHDHGCRRVPTPRPKAKPCPCVREFA
jgi:hypothetical protein